MALVTSTFFATQKESPFSTSGDGYQPIFLFELTASSRFFATQSLVLEDKTYEALLAPVASGGIGTLTRGFNRTGRTVIGTMSVRLLNQALFSDILDTVILDNAEAVVKLGFAGGTSTQYVTIFRGIVDNMVRSYDSFDFSLLDATKKFQEPLAPLIGQKYFRGAVDGKGAPIPIIVGRTKSLRMYQVETNAAGTLSEAVSAASTIFRVAEYSEPFPETGAALVGAETINYTARTVKLVNTIPILEFSGLTRSTGSTHASGTSAAVTNTAYTYLAGYQASNVNVVRNDDAVLSTALYTLTLASTGRADKAVSIVVSTAQLDTVTAEVDGLNLDETELLSNGSFETDTSGWTIDKNTVSTQLLHVIKGPSAIEIQGAALNSTAAQLHQDVTTVAGTKYEIRLWHKDEKVLGTEYLSDGTFEAGGLSTAGPWAIETGSTSLASTSGAQEGAWKAVVGGKSTAFLGITQDITVPANRPLTLSGWHKETLVTASTTHLTNHNFASTVDFAGWTQGAGAMAIINSTNAAFPSTGQNYAQFKPIIGDQTTWIKQDFKVRPGNNYHLLVEAAAQTGGRNSVASIGISVGSTDVASTITGRPGRIFGQNDLMSLIYQFQDFTLPAAWPQFAFISYVYHGDIPSTYGSTMASVRIGVSRSGSVAVSTAHQIVVNRAWIVQFPRDQSIARVRVGSTASPALYLDSTKVSSTSWAAFSHTLTSTLAALRVSFQSQYTGSTSPVQSHFDSLSLTHDDVAITTLEVGSTGTPTAYINADFIVSTGGTFDGGTYTSTGTTTRIQVKGKSPGKTALKSFVDAVTTNPLSDNAVGTMRYILSNFSSLTLNTTAWNNAETVLGGWRFAGVVSEGGSALEVTQRMAEQCKSRVYVDAENKVTILPYNGAAASIYSFTAANIARNSMRVGQSLLDEVYTEFVVWYSPKAEGQGAARFNNATYANPDETSHASLALNAECSAANTTYGFSRKQEIFANMVADKNTADRLLEHLVILGTTRKVVVSFASFLNASHLAEGDIVQITHALLPSGVDGGTFQIQEKRLNPATLQTQFTCWQLINKKPETSLHLDTGLVAWWKLDESSGPRVDSKGSNDLTDENSVGSEEGRVSGLAALFVRANAERLSVADNTSLAFTTDQPFTVSAWVYPITSGATRVIISKGDSGSGVTKQEFQLIIGASSQFILNVGNGSSATGVAAGTYGAAVVNTWQHIVAWHDPAADQLKIQINNGVIDTEVWASGTQDTALELRVGGWSNDDVSNGWWDGKLQDVALWKRVLTAPEREALFTGSRPPF